MPNIGKAINLEISLNYMCYVLIHKTTLAKERFGSRITVSVKYKRYIILVQYYDIHITIYLFR